MSFHNIPPNGFPDLPDMEELEAVVKDVTNLKTSVAGLTTDVSNLSDNKANQITIAPFFNAEASYDPGDLVYYNGLSYRCVNAHEGEWDADDFAATTISGELDTLKSGLIGAAKVPTTSPESAITSIAAESHYTYTATSDGFLGVHAPLAQDAREFNVFMRDINASKYGVSIYAKVIAYHGDCLGGMFVKAGRTYYIDNVGSNSVDLYLNT